MKYHQISVDELCAMRRSLGRRLLIALECSDGAFSFVPPHATDRAQGAAAAEIKTDRTETDPKDQIRRSTSCNSQMQR